MRTAFLRGCTTSVIFPVTAQGDRSRLRLVPWALRPHAHLVREATAPYQAYEPDGSLRRAHGSIGVAGDARWMATLTVPLPHYHVVFLHLERSGALPADYCGSEESTDFSVPVFELEALLALLAGIVTQARRDGVLPAEASDTPHP
jgi:hypothetical protein